MKSDLLSIMWVLLLLASGFSYAESLHTQAGQTKINLYTEHYPPHNMKIDGHLTGLSVDILDAMFKQMKFANHVDDIKLTNWSRAYTLAMKKSNSMVFSTTRTESREPLFKWVGPIVSTEVGIIAPKSKGIIINKLSDLNQYKIGAVLKDVGETLLLDQGVNKKQIFHVDGNDTINLSFTKMLKNRIDLFSYNIGVAFTNAKSEGFDISQFEVVYILKKADLYYAFNKDTSDDVIAYWQKALDEVKEKGIYDKLLKKYYP
ncbi:MAG: ABC transporter substrate-binding protein [Gammaproteobacteria bacterium]|nr:ABC transporter substrate-binding protein [Gammaproteobacteria bacterium]